MRIVKTRGLGQAIAEMIHKAAGSQAGKVQVTFSLPASIWAEQIHLVGSFNDWDRSRTPLRQLANDDWSITLELEADQEYQYRYLIDGETWYTDYNADGFVANEYGTDNSVVRTALDEASGDGPTP